MEMDLRPFERQKLLVPVLENPEDFLTALHWSA